MVYASLALVAALSLTQPSVGTTTRRLCKAMCWPAIERCIVDTAKWTACIRAVRRKCQRDPSVCVGTTTTTLPNVLP